MDRAVYVGEIEHLQGKSAIVRPYPEQPSQISAQFDDTSVTKTGHVDRGVEDWELTSLGYGWHAFPIADFEEIEA